MKLIFLGTGTSQGVPIIGSKSPVSRSRDPHDNRLRTSAAVVTDDGHIILIDCGPDFRYQMLRAGLDDLDGILFTHAHADHTAGLDDVRPICYFRSHDIDLYAKEDVMESIKARFAYVFAKGADRDPGRGHARACQSRVDRCDGLQDRKNGVPYGREKDV